MYLESFTKRLQKALGLLEACQLEAHMMMRTLLRGEACIYGRRVVDTTAKKWKVERR